MKGPEDYRTIRTVRDNLPGQLVSQLRQVGAKCCPLSAGRGHRASSIRKRERLASFEAWHSGRWKPPVGSTWRRVKTSRLTVNTCYSQAFRAAPELLLRACRGEVNELQLGCQKTADVVASVELRAACV